MINELRAKIELYEANAAECDMITKLAMDWSKRTLDERVAAHSREVAAALARLAEGRGAA